MLINLSSTGESSPSKFTNYFLDNITLKPNSKLCLIRASLTRNATHLLNELLNGLISYGYEIEVYTDKVGEHDFEVNITSFLNETKWQNTNLNSHLFGNTEDFFMNHKQCKMLGGLDLT